MLKRARDAQDKWRNLGKVRELLAHPAVMTAQVNVNGR
jgi:hypothetical protein